MELEMALHSLGMWLVYLEGSKSFLRATTMGLTIIF